MYTISDRVLREYKPILYSGSENPKEKERNKQAFMSGESNLLICSLKSGLGLDGIQDRCKVGMMQTLGIKRLQVEGVVLQDEASSVMDSIDTANHLRQLAAQFLDQSSD